MTPREQNEEADALTNGDFSQFKSANRVNLVIDEVKWLILPRMLQVAGDIYEDVTRRTSSREQCPLPAPVAEAGYPRIVRALSIASARCVLSCCK